MWNSAPVTPALVHVDGSGYTALGGPVSRVLQVDMTEDGQWLHVLAERNGVLLLRRAPLANFPAMEERELTRLSR